MDEIFSNPLHPYTKALLGSRPSMNPKQRIEEPPITGDPPSPIDPPSGCRFRTRCPLAEPVCETRIPELGAWTDRASHVAACHVQVPGSRHSKAVPGTGDSKPMPGTGDSKSILGTGGSKPMPGTGESKAVGNA